MFFGDIQKLREKRAGLVKQANDLRSKAIEEKRDLTAAEGEQFDKIHAEVDTLLVTIQREERQLNANSSLEQRTGFRPGDVNPTERRELTDDERKQELQLRNQAILGFLRHGAAELPPEQRAIVQQLHANFTPEERALSTSNSAGGYTIAPDTSFYGQIVEGMKEYSLDESMFEVINSGTGASLPIPTNDDTGNPALTAAENTDNSGSPADLTFGQVTLDAYLRTSGLLKVSNVLIQDSSINVEQYLGKKLGERLARKKVDDLTTGTGSSAPKGIVPAATVGVTAASTTAITYGELIDLKHSVNPVHRKNARFMFHDDVLKAFKKMVDGESRPLWKAGISVGSPDTIDGDPYVINQAMATPAAGAKTIVYGNFKKFMVRNVRGFQIVRLTERFAEYFQTAYIGFARWDSDLVDAGEHPIKVLQQAAS